MRIADLNWMQVEKLLTREDRCVLPVGSTEQHAYLSLATDDILADRLAVEAAAPLDVPVFPAINYGVTPYFADFPGTVSLRLETLVAILEDALESLAHSGFRRVLIVNGHGGNVPAEAPIIRWVETWNADPARVSGPAPAPAVAATAGGTGATAAAPAPTPPAARGRPLQVRFHHWWKAPRVWAKVQALDPIASHASWMENFPLTRPAGVRPPAEAKPMIDVAHFKTLDAARARDYLKDGSFGGAYQRPDDDIHALWRVAVDETRALLEHGWD
jgi:creatinine amidohydrolase